MTKASPTRIRKIHPWLRFGNFAKFTPIKLRWSSVKSPKLARHAFSKSSNTTPIFQVFPIPALALISILTGLAACDAADPDGLGMVQVVFENQSQFDVEELYIHEEALGYVNAESLIAEPLAPGESIADSIPNTKWYVTVFRQPNRDSSVLAYTTAWAWDPEDYPTIIYFDEQFRGSK